MKRQANRLVSVCPHRTQRGHHFNSSVHKFAKKKTLAAVGSLQVVGSDEGVEESSNRYAQLQFKKRTSLKIAMGDMHSPVPRQREWRGPNRAGHRFYMLCAAGRRGTLSRVKREVLRPGS